MVGLLSMELQEDRRMCKDEFDFPGMTINYNNNDNNNNNHSTYNEDWDILNMLDLPMESLEDDGFAEDWDAKLGPIPSEVLKELEYPVLSDKNSQQRHHQTPFRAPSPNSVLESRSSSSNNKGVSFGVELLIPVRTRTKRLRPTVNPWLMSGFIVLPNKDKKRKKLLQNDVGSKKCAHCGISKTPQWRGGPMGPKTLCNACGVRYRSGRLFPEYRPAASPTFVPALHSNCHRKVIEMRQKVK